MSPQELMELAAVAKLFCWAALGGAVGYLASGTTAFVLTRIARKRQIRRMHKARKVEPK